jgi:hypothetical protein
MVAVQLIRAMRGDAIAFSNIGTSATTYTRKTISSIDGGVASSTPGFRGASSYHNYSEQECRDDELALLFC